MYRIGMVFFLICGFVLCAVLYYGDWHVCCAPGSVYVLFVSCTLILWVFPVIYSRVWRMSYRYWYSGFERGRMSRWDSVKIIIDNDPLDWKEEFCFSSCIFYSFQWFPIVITVCALPNIFAIILQIDFKHMESSSITVVVAIVTAVLSFYYNSRLTSRVNNRVKWISDLREEMSTFFGSIGWGGGFGTLYNSVMPVKINKKYENVKDGIKLDGYKYDMECEFQNRFKLMSKLELLLNPAEELHRALITLMRLSLGIAGLEVDKDVIIGLGYVKGGKSADKCSSSKYVCAHWGACGYHYVLYNSGEKDEAPSLLEYDVLVSQIFRVATAVLKTEWEQVKRIK